jgi:hypothetical protein
MSTLKGLLIIVTMLVGVSSLAMALSESAPSNPPVDVSGARNPATLQHLSQRGGMGHTGSASNTQKTHQKGHYAPQ